MTPGSSGLSSLERDTLAALLEEAAAEYEGHSSNDYEVAATAQNRSVIDAAIEYGNRHLNTGEPVSFDDPVPTNGKLFIWDSWLMHYLAHRCRSGLTTADLGVLPDLLEDLAGNPYRFYEGDDGGEDFSLSATEPHRELLSATITHAKRAGWQAKVEEIAVEDDTISAYKIDLLRWLAHRCRTAGNQPDAGRSRADAQATQTGARLGVLKGWISEKTLAKRAVEQDESWLPAYAANRVAMQTYADGGNPFREYDDNDVPCLPPFAELVARNVLWGAEHEHQRLAILSMFGSRTDASWRSELQKSVTYRFWRIWVQMLARGAVDFGEVALLVADCLSLGFEAQAKWLAIVLQDSFARGKVESADGLPLFHWIVRIVFDHFGLDAGIVGSRAGEDLPGTLIEQRLAALALTADLSNASEALIWLCDFYTHRTQYAERPAPPTEFGNHWVPARYPSVILAWFRVRELSGLENPAIDHVLMKPRYSKLLPALPFYSDDVLDGIIARLRREELPQLGDYAVTSIPVPSPKPAPDDPGNQKFLAIPRTDQWLRGIGVDCYLPSNWLNRGLPEVGRFVEPETGTQFAFSGYRNPGLSYLQWADARLPAFSAAAPWLAATGERYQVIGQKWWGAAQEFCGVRPGERVTRRCLVLCWKSPKRLLSLVISATQASFEANEELYRWLMRSQIFSHRIPDGPELWAERQDLPGFTKVGVLREWVETERQMHLAWTYVNGIGDTDAARAATRDKVYAAEWYERAAEQNDARAQYNLSILLSAGDGVAQDIPRAIHWCERAVAQGHPKASLHLRSLQSLAAGKKPFWKIW